MITLQLSCSQGILAVRQASDEDELKLFRKQLNKFMHRWEQNYPRIASVQLIEIGKLYDWVKVNVY
jgi:hypothetical protein